MTLSTAWSEIVADWDASFPQQSTLDRGWRLHAALWHVCDHGTPRSRFQGTSAL
jgi:hypothetical protein